MCKEYVDILRCIMVCMVQGELHIKKTRQAQVRQSNKDLINQPRFLVTVRLQVHPVKKHEAHPMILIQYIDPRRLPLDN